MSKIERTSHIQSAETGRRQFVALTGAGIGWLLGDCLCNAGVDTETERILQRDDKIDIGGKGREIIEKTYELGYDYEKRFGG
jgi:hypothetical protein